MSTLLNRAMQRQLRNGSGHLMGIIMPKHSLTQIGSQSASLLLNNNRSTKMTKMTPRSYSTYLRSTPHRHHHSALFIPGRQIGGGVIRSYSSKDDPQQNHQHHHHQEQHTFFVQQGPPQPHPDDKIEWRLWGSGRTYSNSFLFSIGLVISLVSLSSLVLAQVDDDRNKSDKQAKYRYFSNLLSYYWWAPPIGLWINNGEMDELINDYKTGQLSTEGILLLYQISGFSSGRKILFQRGIVEAICDRVDSYFETPEPGASNDQIVLRYQPPSSLALELSLLVNLSVFSGQKVSEETKHKILQLKKILNPGQQRPFDNDFLVERSQLLGHVQEVYESPLGVLGLGMFALGGAFFAFAMLRKQPQWIRQTGMRNSAVACGLVASIHYYRNMSYDKFISKSRTYSSYVGKVELASLLYSTAVIMVAGLPYIFWVLPCITMYTIHMVYQSIKVVNIVKKDLEQSKLVKKSQSPFDD